MSKDEVLAFLKTRKHAVIATVSAGSSSEAALIGFGQTENLEVNLWYVPNKS